MYYFLMDNYEMIGFWWHQFLTRGRQTDRERERERERARQSESRTKEGGGRSAVSRTDGCEQMFYKDQIWQFMCWHSFTNTQMTADVLVRTKCRLMKKNLCITYSEIYHIWYPAWLTTARVQNWSLFIAVYLWQRRWISVISVSSLDGDFGVCLKVCGKDA